MAGKAGRRIYKSPLWRRVRVQILERDGYTCKTCGKHGGRLECHHRRPIEDGGDWFDPDNLETICRTCHIQEAKDRNRRSRKIDPRRNALKGLVHNGRSG